MIGRTLSHYKILEEISRGGMGNRTAPALHLIPPVIRFLGYAPYTPSQGFPERLKACRRALGLRQEELAEILGVDESTLARWEAGKGRPRKNHLEVLKVFFASQSGS